MKTLSAVSVAVALAVGALAVASPALATEPTWQDPPTDLSNSVVDTWSGSATVTPGTGGSLLAVWIEGGPDVGHLRSSFWSEGAWSAGAPATVSNPVGADLDDVEVVSRANGSFVAVWTEYAEDADFQQSMTVMTNTFASGSWSTPTILRAGPADSEINDLQLASAPNSAVIAAWDLDGDIETVILGASGWGAIQALGEGSNPAVAASPTSTLAITWNHETVDNRRLPAAKTFTGSTWSTMVLLSDNGGFAPELGASPTGFVAFWMEGNSRLPFASTFTGTSWSSKVAMRADNQIGGGVTAPGFVVPTPEGTAVTWSDGEWNSAIIWTRVFTGTTWSAPVELLDATQVGLDHHVVGASDGTFMIVWQKNGGGPLMARSFTATTVGAPFMLSAASNFPIQPHLAVGSNGYVVATWQQGGSVVARIFDGENWGESVADFGGDSTSRVAATSDNVFVVAWEWYGDDRGLIRATWIATPDVPTDSGDSGGEELAATGPAHMASIGAVGAAVAVLMGALALAIARRRTAPSAQ